MTGYIHMRLRKHTSVVAMLRTFFQVNKFVGRSVSGNFCKKSCCFFFLKMESCLISDFAVAYATYLGVAYHCLLHKNFISNFQIISFTCFEKQTEKKRDKERGLDRQKGSQTDLQRIE